jgi:Methyl-accepting chemotaxis protein (MCP) signalling domain
MTTRDALTSARHWIPRGGKVPQKSFDARHRVMIGVVVAHAIVLVAVALVLHDSVRPLLIWLTVVATLTTAGLLLKGRLTRSSATSLALLCCAAALVELTNGSITSHFDFFVVLAFVAMYQEWAPYLLSVLFTLVQHLSMGFLMPSMVFGDPVLARRPILWAFIHAAFVVAACIAGILCWGLSEAAQDDALSAQTLAAEAVEAQRAAQEETADQQRQLAENAQAAATAADGSARDAVQLAEQLSRDATAAGSRVTDVAGGLEQLHASITEVAHAAARASRAGQEASGRAATVNIDVNNLAVAAEQIGSVISIITAIATQTKLLSLNATIEAARAGESGRGFAVVAQEVKALAAETATATDEIARVIENLQAISQGAVTGLATITEGLDAIGEISTEIAMATEEQRQTSASISGALQDAATAVEAISTVARDRLETRLTV